MECREAQERILESLALSGRRPETLGLEGHLAGCDACRSFREIQAALDRQLSAVMAPPSPSLAFRAAVLKRIRRDPLAVWPESLPDLAHLAGGVFATALCVWMLPFRADTVILAGMGFTLATFFLQAVIRESFEV